MIIKLVHRDGREVVIDNVKPSDRIIDLKERFALMECISPSAQRYIDLYGRFFRDSQTVKELSLRDGFKIYLVNANHFIRT